MDELNRLLANAREGAQFPGALAWRAAIDSGIPPDPLDAFSVDVFRNISILGTQPQHELFPIDFISVYVTSDDYIDVTPFGVADVDARAAILEFAVEDVGLTDALVALCILSVLNDMPDDLKSLGESFAGVLPEPTRSRLANLLDSQTGPSERVLLSRQGILAGFRHVIETFEANPSAGPTNAVFKAVLMVHALSAGFRSPDDIDDGRIGDVPEQLALEIVVNQYFNRTSDPVALINRTVHLWNLVCERANTELEGRHQSDVLWQATGLKVEEIVAFALVTWNHFKEWSIDKPLFFSLNGSNAHVAAAWNRFTSLFASTPEELRLRMMQAASDWDFLEFQKTPLLELEKGLLQADGWLLLDRVTNGLYWLAHDVMRQEGSGNQLAWTRAWGAIVEEYAERIIETFVPTALDGSKLVYFEEDLASAYGPASRRADAVVDHGVGVCVFEIVSGQLTTGTRLALSREAFEADLDKLVYKKLAQLDSACANLVRSPEAMFPGEAAVRPIQPILVLGGGFPVNHVTIGCAEAWAHDKRLFSDASIKPIAMIDLDELEMLQTLAQNGENVFEVVGRWLDSRLGRMSFRNWVYGSVDDAHTDLRLPTAFDDFSSAINAAVERLQSMDEP